MFSMAASLGVAVVVACCCWCWCCCCLLLLLLSLSLSLWLLLLLLWWSSSSSWLLLLLWWWWWWWWWWSSSLWWSSLLWPSSSSFRCVFSCYSVFWLIVLICSWLVCCLLCIHVDAMRAMCCWMLSSLFLSSVLFLCGNLITWWFFRLLPGCEVWETLLNLGMAPHQSPNMDDQMNLTKLIEIKLIIWSQTNTITAIVMSSTSTKPAIASLQQNVRF